MKQLDELIIELEKHKKIDSLSDEFLEENYHITRKGCYIGNFSYGIVYVAEDYILPYLKELQKLKREANVEKVLQEDRRVIEAVVAGIRATVTKPDALLYLGEGWNVPTVAGLPVYYSVSLKCMHWSGHVYTCDFIPIWRVAEDGLYADRKRFADAYSEIMGGEGE